MAARTWIADTTKNWSDATAWDGGVSVPATTDSVTFNATHVGACTIDNLGTWSGGNFTINGYTVGITKNAGVAITIAIFSQSSGQFNVGTGTFTSTTFGLSGGTFALNNSGNFSGGATTINGGTFTISSTGTFTTTTLAVSSGILQRTAGSAAWSTTAVTFSSTGTITATSGTWTLAGSWTQTGSTTTFTASSGTINITAASTFDDARSTFNKINVTTAAAAVTIAAGTTAPLGATPSTTVTTNTLTINGTVTWTGTWTHVGSITTGSAAVLTGSSTPRISMDKDLTINATATITNALGTITFTGAVAGSTLTDTGDKLSGTTFVITKASTMNFTVAASTTCRLGASPSTVANLITVTGTLNLSGTWSLAGGLSVGSAGTLSGALTDISQTVGTVWTINATATIPSGLNYTFTPAVSQDDITFSGGGKTYGVFRYNLTNGTALGGVITINDSNTFGEFHVDQGSATTNQSLSIVFQANQTQTCAVWDFKGLPSFYLTITSSSAGTAATLANTSGVYFESDFLDLKDVAVDATPRWYAGFNSRNRTGNTNWKFTSARQEEAWNAQIASYVRAGTFGEQLQPVRRNTAQAGADGTMTLDAAASAVDNFYNGSMIYIVSGTGAGQARAVTAYNGTTKVATVSPTWVTNPDSTSVFVLWWMANADTYQAKVTIDRDTANTTDRYSAAFFKNGQPITSGITSPTIQVIKQTDGTDLVASTALTQVASSGLYKYTEATNRISTGAAYYAIVTATIDGASRTWNQPISRDA